MNAVEKRVEYQNHTKSYCVYRDFTWLDRIELAEGYSVWMVCATYAKQLRGSDYYVIARSSREARRGFLRAFPWLSCIQSVQICLGADERGVLSNPGKHIIISA